MILKLFSRAACFICEVYHIVSYKTSNEKCILNNHMVALLVLLIVICFWCLVVIAVAMSFLFYLLDQQTQTMKMKKGIRACFKRKCQAIKSTFSRSRNTEVASDACRTFLDEFESYSMYTAVMSDSFSFCSVVSFTPVLS